MLVIIGDQGYNNRNLFETELGVSIEKPFFTVNERQIFVMYDPPHLVKNVRNNMKKHGFKLKEKVISWQQIKDFYHKDSSKPIRLNSQANTSTYPHLHLYELS